MHQKGRTPDGSGFISFHFCHHITITVATAVAVAIAGPCHLLSSLSCVDVLLPPLSVRRQHRVHRHFRVGRVYIIEQPSSQSHPPSFQPLLLALCRLLPSPSCHQPLMQSPSTYAIDTVSIASTWAFRYHYVRQAFHCWHTTTHWLTP